MEDDGAPGAACLTKGTAMNRPTKILIVDDEPNIRLVFRMPLVDGMETPRRIRDEGLRVPVILGSAHGSIPDAVRAMRLGAVDFLAKPVAPDPDFWAAVSAAPDASLGLMIDGRPAAGRHVCLGLVASYVP